MLVRGHLAHLLLTDGFPVLVPPSSSQLCPQTTPALPCFSFYRERGEDREGKEERSPSAKVTREVCNSKDLALGFLYTALSSN